MCFKPYVRPRILLASDYIPEMANRRMRNQNQNQNTRGRFGDSPQ